MLYTPMTKAAMRIAFDAHKDQVDKAGLPYIFHPIHVAEQMEDEVSVCAALLHDVAEDTAVSFEEMEGKGIGREVIDVLKLLTHAKDVPYLDYVKNIRDSGNKAAAAVKLADLRHNADLTRLETVDDQAMRRAVQFRQAMELLLG